MHKNSLDISINDQSINFVDETRPGHLRQKISGANQVFFCRASVMRPLTLVGIFLLVPVIARGEIARGEIARGMGWFVLVCDLSRVSGERI